LLNQQILDEAWLMVSTYRERGWNNLAGDFRITIESEVK
jgi:hypothetical protein